MHLLKLATSACQTSVALGELTVRMSAIRQGDPKPVEGVVFFYGGGGFTTLAL